MDETIKASLKESALLDYFENIPSSHQREYLNWINQAKKRAFL